MNVSVVGLGKLGSPLAAVLASAGHNVIGYDVSHEYVEAVQHGKAPVEETGLQAMMSANQHNLTATHDAAEAAKHGDFIFVIVPTPSGDDGRFRCDYLVQACEAIGPHLKHGQVVVIVSTVCPLLRDGKTVSAMRTEIVPVLERLSDLRCGVDFGVCYNPEFIALGSVIDDLLHPDFILIGESDEVTGSRLEMFYKQLLRDVQHPACVRRMNFINAELTKIGVNQYITMKISFANMFGMACQEIAGADASVILQAIGTDTRVGAKYLKPGMPFAGPCFPRDGRALIAVLEGMK